MPPVIPGVHGLDFACGRRLWAEEDGAASEEGGSFGVGQAVGAVGEVCGVSWGDMLHFSWSGMTRLGDYLDFKRQNRSGTGLD